MCFLVGGWVVLGTIFFFFFVLVFDYGDGVQCKDLYLLVKQKVEDSISLLKQTREKDPERSLPVRLFAKTMRLLPVNLFSSSSR